MSPALLQLAVSTARLYRSSATPAVSRLARLGFATVDTSASETHDDFKPKYKQAPTGDSNVDKQIERDIQSHDVFIYMKGVPTAPQCGFSNMACRVLDAYGVRYGARNVLADPAVRDGIKKFSNWPTIPQIYVKGEFVGGSDILYNMHQSGELEKLLDPIVKQQQNSAK